MNFLINPNFAYLFFVAAVMLVFAGILFPRSNGSKIGALICLVGAVYTLLNLRVNPWALLAAGLSPLPYFMATQQTGPRRTWLVVAAGMFVFGSAFMLVDEKGLPTINVGLILLVSTVCAQFIWVSTERRLNAQSTRHGANPDSLVGLIGTAITQIDDVGLVEIEGETCSARSDHPIPAGSTVRVLKYEGRILVVKKAEKLTGK